MAFRLSDSLFLCSQTWCSSIWINSTDVALHADDFYCKRVYPLHYNDCWTSIVFSWTGQNDTAISLWLTKLKLTSTCLLVLFLFSAYFARSFKLLSRLSHIPLEYILNWIIEHLICSPCHQNSEKLPPLRILQIWLSTKEISVQEHLANDAAGPCFNKKKSFDISCRVVADSKLQLSQMKKLGRYYMYYVSNYMKSAWTEFCSVLYRKNTSIHQETTVRSCL